MLHFEEPANAGNEHWERTRGGHAAVIGDSGDAHFATARLSRADFIGDVRRLMGEFVLGRSAKIVGWGLSLLILALNAALIFGMLA